ncbi:FxLYD domain-containing protein [Chromobacterium amazonense]|uniref:FxLYD domain-containing protein n=1 Tax=Chromobacterium amazonense TaxID=1382803 RepID=UPI003F79552B
MKKLFSVFVALLFSVSVYAQNAGVTVVDTSAQQEPGPITTISGVAKNDSGKKIAAVFIKFNVMDGSGNVIGNAIANLSDFEPGTTWKFAAKYPGVFVRYKLVSIETY